MKYLKYLAAVVLTLVMLYIARSNSAGRPEYVTGSDGGFSFEMITVPKITELKQGTLSLTIAGPVGDSNHVWFRTSQPEGSNVGNMDTYGRLEMRAGDSPGEFIVDVTAGKRGGRFYYFFEITNSDYKPEAVFMSEEEKPFLLKYIGEVPSVILSAHVVFIFATVFFVALAAVSGFPLIVGGSNARPVVLHLFLAAAFCFVGGWVFGIPMNYYAFDTLWEGVPFGTDATDNKTQLLFVYLLFAALSGLRTLTRGRFGRDIGSPKVLGWAGLSAMAVMLFIYLIPHSIQFSPELTKTFCYSWIGVVVVLFLFAYSRTESIGKSPEVQTD